MRLLGASLLPGICGFVLIAAAAELQPSIVAASPRLAVPGHPELGIAEPEIVTIELSDLRCTASRVVLAPGTPVVLRLRNGSGDKSSLSAAGFFAAAQVDPNGAALVHDGRVEV